MASVLHGVLAAFFQTWVNAMWIEIVLKGPEFLLPIGCRPE
jgi:hypothetical protein